MNALYAVIIIVVMAFAAMYGYKIFLETKEDISEDIESPKAQAAFDEIEQRYPSIFDGAIAFVFFLIWIFVIVSGFIRDSHPVLFGVSLIVIMFIIIGGMFIGNFYEETFNDSELIEVVDYFPITNWILTNMMIIGIIFGFSALIAAFAAGLRQ